MKESYFNGVWRMDWGFGNPNKTAVLIALLMIGIWALAYLRKWGFWLALLSFIGLGICLVHTASRGGLVAVCGGLAVILWYLPQPWMIPRIGAIFVGLVIVLASSIYLKTYARYGEGIAAEDASISNRVALWCASPRMMVDAPSGWGIGNSGRAYMGWYQPLSHHEAYRTLVNSHLTWLVELGWALRFLYVMTCLSVFALTFPNRERVWTAIPFGIWIAFFVGSFFSSVAESVWLWILPLVSLALVLVMRWRLVAWPKISVWITLAVFSVLILGLFFAVGSSTPGPKIVASVDRIVFGEGNPDVWILVDPRVIGSDYGRLLRQSLPSYSVGFITTSNFPPDIKGDTLIVCGAPSKEALQAASALANHFQKVLFVNPSFYPQECKISGPVQSNALFGEFSHSPSINEWETTWKGRVTILPGVGDFIPRWPIILLGLK